MTVRIQWLALTAILVSLTQMGCQTASNRDKGALIGSGLGAAAGAIIGNQVGERDKGALIGGALGAVTGGIAGDNQDKLEERDHAIAQAHHQHAMRRAEIRAMSNQDVLDMKAQQIDDEIILDTIRDRGGRFDTSPQAISTLATNGVSNSVIREMRNNNISGY